VTLDVSLNMIFDMGLLLMALLISLEIKLDLTGESTN